MKATILFIKTCVSANRTVDGKYTVTKFDRSCNKGVSEIFHTEREQIDAFNKMVAQLTIPKKRGRSARKSSSSQPKSLGGVRLPSNKLQ